jgi:hypothetical protein
MLHIEGLRKVQYKNTSTCKNNDEKFSWLSAVHLPQITDEH